MASGNGGSSSSSKLWDKYVAAGCHLGAGEHSDVAVVLRKSDGKRFACKTTRLDGVNGGGGSCSSECRRAMKRVQVEVECLHKMEQHLGVVHYEEMIMDPDAWHLVMELCDCSLADWIRDRGKIPEPEAALIVQDLASTLADLHGCGIMHRDVKPDNILLLLKKSGNNKSATSCCCKYADFGIAFQRPQHERQTPLSERVGTPRYVAPEVISGRYWFPADVWSLGATLYHMLAGGGHLFADYSTSGLLSDLKACAIAADSCLDWTGISPGAQDLIRSMMHKNPFKRPKPADILRHPWIQQHKCASPEQQQQNTSSSSSSSSGNTASAAASCSATNHRLELPLMISIS